MVRALPRVFFLTLGLAALVNLFFHFLPGIHLMVTQMVGQCVAASCSNTTKDGVVVRHSSN